jgi:hypothetical protein
MIDWGMIQPNTQKERFTIIFLSKLYSPSTP